MSNMRQAARIAVVRSARISAPVFSQFLAIRFQRSGIGAAERQQGREWLDQTRPRPPSRQMTLRCRLFPPRSRSLVADEGSETSARSLRPPLDRLAPGAAIGRVQVRKPFGIWPLPKLVMSTAACAAGIDLVITISVLRRRQQVGSPPSSCGKKPIPSSDRSPPKSSGETWHAARWT